MAIVRSPRPDGRFVVLDKAVSEDRRLSWAARGLLVFLLGKPDNWTVRAAHLVDQTGGARIATGRDGVYALLGELIEAGYVVREDQSRANGAFSEAGYTVHDQPQTAAPYTAQPDTAQAHTAEPELSKEPTAARTEKANKDGGEKKRAGARLEFVPPAWVPAEPWREFVEMRQRLRAPLTESAARLAVRELERLRVDGHHPGEVLQQSTLRAWRGLFPIRAEREAGGDFMAGVRRTADAFANGGAP